MAASLDYLESILWPRYAAPALDLCQALWRVANPKQSSVASPEWFNEIIELQVKSILMLTFSAPQTWVVFPEPVPGFTVAIHKKPQGAHNGARQQRLSLRNHSFDQFSELARLVEKAAVKLLRRATVSGVGDVIELENEDGHVFCFPREKTQEYLLALGFSEEQIPKLLSVDDIIRDC